MVMNKDVNNGQSRREFLGRSVAALAAASFLPSAFSCTGKSVAAPAPVDTAAEAGKVNSKFGGVQIGTITYSWRSMPRRPNMRQPRITEVISLIIIRLT